MTLDSAIVDVGASNVEEFIKQMGQFDGSHEEFDYFVVPAVSEKKQQIDTVNTIETLAGLGVPAKKIRVVFNKVELEDTNDVPRLFGTLFGLHAETKWFTLRPEAVVFKNEIFDRLRSLKKTVSEIVADETDYRAMLREAKDEDAKAHAVSMISAQRLAKSANKNLDDVYKALFK
ncbi:StbB family protein [Xanthomonas citri]|nr:StbB family protein [Xanthomonas citri]